MAGLFNALNAARTSLEVNQKSIEIVGNNISNVNTEGYSRQYAQFETYPAVNFGDFFIGNGVKVASVQRDHDIFLQAQLEDKYVDYGYANGQTNSLSELERIFNITDDNLATDVDKFFDAWQELSASPSDLVLRDTVIQYGRLLATTFNNTADSLNTITGNINDTIIAKVEDLNASIEEIAELNDRIYTIEIRGQGANTARDKRDVLVKKLAEGLGATTYLDNNGMVNVQLPGGLPLVQGNMAMTLAADTSGATVTLTLTTGGITRDLNSRQLGGEMAGLFTMRDDFIPSTSHDLDKLAWELSNTVNTQHLAGTGLDGMTVSSFFNDVSTLPVTNAARNMHVVITRAEDVAA
ncbi:MAG: flagellar hook-associated protein FlgK, partial [Proteobacteria bacterium]